MIPFFRKIRKQLANDNKPLKYMRYAIGEIVLVVIGILIALSINNWNEARKEKVKERKILIELENNLAANSKILSDEISNQKRIANQISVTIKHLENKKPFNDSIGKYVNQIQWIESTQFVSSAYESLKTSGVDLISNDSIRADVTFLFGNEFPFRTTWLNDVGTTQANWTHPIIMRFFKQGPPVPALTSYKIATDYDGLLQNQEFINVISSRRAFKGEIVYQFEKLLIRVENARARINKELETFD
jgi:hypothetical protein